MQFGLVKVSLLQSIDHVNEMDYDRILQKDLDHNYEYDTMW